MNAEEMIARNKRLNRMRELLEAPPLSSIALPEELAQRIMDQQELIGQLAAHIAAQGQAIIEMRQVQAAQQAAIETLANLLGAEKDEAGSGLLGFNKPKLVVN